MQFKLSAAACLMLAVVSAENPNPCEDEYWIMIHEMADCSDFGIRMQYPLNAYFEEFTSNTCESLALGEGTDLYQQSQCDDKGFHLITFSDAECTTEKERTATFEWNQCVTVTDQKISVWQTKPEEP